MFDEATELKKQRTQDAHGGGCSGSHEKAQAGGVREEGLGRASHVQASGKGKEA